jgi:hypothetical protein
MDMPNYNDDVGQTRSSEAKEHGPKIPVGPYRFRTWQSNFCDPHEGP